MVVTANYNELMKSPMMARLLDALCESRDVGHYGRLVFTMVARHFLPKEDIVYLLSKQPEQDHLKAETMYEQISRANYSPPKPDTIRRWQETQDFKLIETNDPDEGNVYKDLQFPRQVTNHIGEYYSQKVIAHKQ